MSVTFPIFENQSAHTESTCDRSWTPPDSSSLGSSWVPVSRYFILLLALFAFTVSAYLGYIGLTASKIAGCGGSLFNCDHVLNTKWSTWMGIPVGVLATALYTIMITALIVSFQTRSPHLSNLAMSTVTMTGLSAGVVAMWFIGLQVFAIGHLCLWCLVAHTCGIVISVILISTKPLGRRIPTIPMVAALGGAALLISGQVLAKPPQTYEVQTFPMAETGTEEAFGSPEDLSNADSNVNEAVVTEPDVFGSPVHDAPVFESPVFESPVFESPVFESPVVLPDTSQLKLDELPETLTAIETSQLHPSTQPYAIAGIPPFIIVLMISIFLQSLCGHSIQAEEQQSQDSTQAQEKPVSLVVFGGGIRLNRANWPAIGSTDARYVFVEMFDYTCPHCRATHHHAIKKLKTRYGKDLSIVTLPVPLNSKCNSTVQSTSAQAANSCDLAKLAVAVWLTDREKFSEFHDWMFEPQSPRSLANARNHAEQLVDKERLKNILSQKVCDEYIARHVQLYQKVGSGAVPKLLFEKTALVGEVSSPDHISTLLEQQFGSR